MSYQQVVISVSGGVAEISKKPVGVEVVIIDYDLDEDYDKGDSQHKVDKYGEIYCESVYEAKEEIRNRMSDKISIGDYQILINYLLNEAGYCKYFDEAVEEYIDVSNFTYTYDGVSGYAWVKLFTDDGQFIEETPFPVGDDAWE